MIYINPYLSVPINTIIGGVSGSISTKAALAAKLVIPESIITRFQIVGSDVHAHISAIYSIPASCFQSDLTITKYIDLSKHCAEFQLNCFSGANNLINIYAPKAYLNNGSVGSVNGSNVSNADYAFTYYYENSTINALGALRRIKIKHLVALSLTTVPQTHFLEGVSTLETINAPLLTNIPSNGLQNCYYLNSFTHSNIISIDTFGMDGCTSIPYLHLDSLTTITGTYALRGLSSCTEIIAPLLESIPNKDLFFRNWTSCNLIRMRKLKIFGNSSIVSNAFQNLKVGCTVEVNIALATANSGSVDAALVWVKANRAAIVKFYDDAGNYVSTL